MPPVTQVKWLAASGCSSRRSETPGCGRGLSSCTTSHPGQKLPPQHPCQWPFSPRWTCQDASLAPHRPSIPPRATTVRKVFGTESPPLTYLSGASRASRHHLPPPSLTPAPTPPPSPPPPKKARSGSDSHGGPRRGAGLHPAASSR